MIDAKPDFEMALAYLWQRWNNQQKYQHDEENPLVWLLCEVMNLPTGQIVEAARNLAAKK